MAQKLPKLDVSIGIFAHNEEKNIARAIESVLKQKTEIAQIKDIIIVSSGSFDRTNPIVRSYEKQHKYVSLIMQAERKGKSAAINLFLRNTKSPIAITMSADLELDQFAIEEMCLPFLDESVGMVGGHPTPNNTKQSNIGKEMQLLWELHHLVSLQKPKCGELVGFRNTIHQIPRESAVDEAAIEVLLTLIGYQVVYAPRAIVYNKVPQDFRQLLLQRRRVYTGHQWIQKKYNYTVSTLSSSIVIESIIGYLLEHPSELATLVRLGWYELIARLLGWIDFNIRKKNPYIWNMVAR